MANLINGKEIAEELRSEIKADVKDLVETTGKKPGLAVVLVGEDPASQVYVNMKHKACENLGIESFQHILHKETTEEDLLTLVDSLNKNDDVNGILVQLPLPEHIDEDKVITAISPEKDVDGFHPYNVGKFVIGAEDSFLPCTPYGCQILINKAVENTKGKHVVIVGRSNIVGKPLANMLVQKNKNADCIVTVCHSASDDISYYTKQADILVAAAGRPGLITGDMVKDGVVVIDVGTNRVDNPDNPEKKKLVGDVDFDSVEKKASAITPVPGGVGPMTITMLMYNTVKAFKMHNNIK